MVKSLERKSPSSTGEKIKKEEKNTALLTGKAVKKTNRLQRNLGQSGLPIFETSLHYIVTNAPENTEDQNVQCEKSFPILSLMIC